MSKLFQTSHSLADQLFEGRNAKVENASYQQHFLQLNVPAQVSEGVKLVLEEQLGTDLSRLRTSDDFRCNLAFFFQLDSLADVEIVYALEQRFNINIRDSEAERTSSIEDIVLLVNRKLGSTNDV